MDVLIVLVFVSLVLVGGAILLLCVSLHQRDFEHAERLALLPLLDSDRESGPGARATDACGDGDGARGPGPRRN